MVTSSLKFHSSPHPLLPFRYSDVESGLIFVGLAALQDPPRPEVAPAIRRCKQVRGPQGLLSTTL